jgi:ABC-type transporter Mla maintaining outer membrane lipid asymmetry ATPase subunit MlaF
MAQILALESVTTVRAGREILRDMSLEIDRGEIFAIVAHSGSGKSSILKLFLGILTPDSGVVRVDGADISRLSYRELQALRTRIGFVFQDAGLINNLTLYDNVALAVRYHTRLRDEEVDSRVMATLERLKITRHMEKRPAAVSAGVRKRTLFARAMILEPSIMLLDTPFSGASPSECDIMIGLMKKLREERGVTFVVVTNNLSFVFLVPDRLGILSEGRSVEVGKRDDVLKSKNPEVKQLLYGKDR